MKKKRGDRSGSSFFAAEGGQNRHESSAMFPILHDLCLANRRSFLYHNSMFCISGRILHYEKTNIRAAAGCTPFDRVR